MKRLALIFLLASLPLLASAQMTKIRGKVTDAATGEGVPFAAIFFKGSTIGVTTDMDGNYSLETRHPETDVVICQILGYDTQEKQVRLNTFSTLNFSMSITENRISSSFVKADNRRIKRMLAAIDKNRDRNNPEKKPQYTCEIYNKMELDLTHPKEQLKGKRFLKEFGFVFDYMDTSVVSGVPYLPVMISETVARRTHSLNPAEDNEIIEANKVSGIEPDDNNLLTQFTGSMHLRINFYKDFINSFGVNFPSPLQSNGLLYYNYFIIDSLCVDNRKTYMVRFHPKQGISSPAFDGEMFIDAEDFALQSINAKMKRGGNVNWLRDLVIETHYSRLDDSTWFYKTDKMYADFSVAMGDSSKLMSFLGTRLLEYTGADFSELAQKPSRSASIVGVDKDAFTKTEEFWDSRRPYELSDKEKKIYGMVDAIKEQPLYRDLYSVVTTIINGYWDIGPVGFGPYLKLISFNNLEGFRARLGIHTSKDLSQKFRFTAFGAYGTRDHAFKGGLTFEYLFSREPTSKLTIDGHYDIYQIGGGKSNFTSGNLLSSLWAGPRKLSPMLSVSALYDHEFSSAFNIQAEAHLKTHYSNQFVPMVDWNGCNYNSVKSNELRFQARFSKDETVNRGYFIKTYVHSYYPVLTIDLTGGIPGIRPGDVGFFKPELTLDYTLRVPPVGTSRFHLNVGTIIGQVPYPFLNIFAGNVTWMYDKSTFSCLDFFEFASDSWVTLFYDHNFNGFFLGKIPLIKKLKLREVLTVKFGYGTLSDKNNGTDARYGAPLQFPEGMKPMTVPYVEIGAGITNILRVFRVDCFWRLTNRENARRNFAVQFGLDFKF